MNERRGSEIQVVDQRGLLLLHLLRRSLALPVAGIRRKGGLERSNVAFVNINSVHGLVQNTSEWVLWWGSVLRCLQLVSQGSQVGVCGPWMMTNDDNESEQQG